MESVDKFKNEMQARVDELRPYVDGYAQIQELLEIIDNAKGKAAAYAEETVPAFQTDKPKKQRKYTRKARKRTPANDGFKTRAGLVKKYLAEHGTSDLKGIREYDGRQTFTFGSLMNAMDACQYAGYTWGRALGANGLADKLVQNGVIELVYENQELAMRTRKYYAITQ